MITLLLLFSAITTGIALCICLLQGLIILLAKIVKKMDDSNFNDKIDELNRKLKARNTLKKAQRKNKHKR